MKADPRAREFAHKMRGELTDAETILWSRLQGRRLNGWRFRRQHPVGPFIADFACARARLIVEVDGATHSSNQERAYDDERTRYLEAQSWSVLRVWNSDVYDNLNGVLNTIIMRLNA